MVITYRTFDLSFLVRIHNLGVSKEKLRDGSGYQQAKSLNFRKTTKGRGGYFPSKKLHTLDLYIGVFRTLSEENLPTPKFIKYECHCYMATLNVLLKAVTSDPST